MGSRKRPSEHREPLARSVPSKATKKAISPSSFQDSRGGVQSRQVQNGLQPPQCTWGEGN